MRFSVAQIRRGRVLISISNNISKNMNNMSIITTHFSYLSKLEKTGKFKNYFFEAERDEFSQ